MSKAEKFNFNQTSTDNSDIDGLIVEPLKESFYSFWYDYAMTYNGSNRVHADVFASAHKYEVPKLTI